LASFGYGKHACPGRFYAVRKVKLIFSRLLLNYDIEWASPRSGMPTRLSMNGQFAPNQEQMIRIKRRKALLGTN
jgi:cytochrome P450